MYHFVLGWTTLDCNTHMILHVRCCSQMWFNLRSSVTLYCGTRGTYTLANQSEARFANNQFFSWAKSKTRNYSIKESWRCFEKTPSCSRCRNTKNSSFISSRRILSQFWVPTDLVHSPGSVKWGASCQWSSPYCPNLSSNEITIWKAHPTLQVWNAPPELPHSLWVIENPIIEVEPVGGNMNFVMANTFCNIMSGQQVSYQLHCWRLRNRTDSVTLLDDPLTLLDLIHFS